MCKKVNELNALAERLNNAIAVLDGEERYEIVKKNKKEPQYQLRLVNNDGMKTGQFGHLITWYPYMAISCYIEGICLALEWIKE